MGDRGGRAPRGPAADLHAGEVAPMRAVGRGPLLQTTRTSGKALSTRRSPSSRR
ncbi:hypothetical protein [Kibdelosporangium philippinense]|uniref:hypothetical protein n=1 Tax=Kibdelosporangium philippinense TaxID=211113 RepID=UPI0036201C0B